VLISSLGLMRGGIETIAAALAGGLAERGHEVTVIAGAWPGQTLSPELAALPVRWLHVPCVPVRLTGWRYVARRRPGWPLKTQSLTFVCACRLHRHARAAIELADITTTFFEIEATLFSLWRAQYGRPNLSYFSGGIDGAWLWRDRSVVRVAISQMIAARFAHIPGFRVDGVLPPGVPDAWLEVPYHVRPEARTLIFVGRLEANKGIMELLTIFQALAGAVPQLRLRILGAGPLQEQLDAAIAGAGLADRVTCLGALPAEQVHQELRDADLFVFPSRYESFGIAVLEAQAVGVPVVCSDLPALREVVGATGLLVPVGAIDRWVEAIRSLLGDQARRERMSLAGRESARRFTWRRGAQELERYFLLGGSRGA